MDFILRNRWYAYCGMSSAAKHVIKAGQSSDTSVLKAVRLPLPALARRLQLVWPSARAGRGGVGGVGGVGEEEERRRSSQSG